MLNKQAQQEYADAIQKIAYVHDVDPYALDEYLTKQANQPQQAVTEQEVKKVLQRHPNPEEVLGLFRKIIQGLGNRGARLSRNVKQMLFGGGQQ